MLCCENRFRLAGQAEAEAQQRHQHLQEQVLQLHQQLEDQGCVLAHTKKQVLFLSTLFVPRRFPQQHLKVNTFTRFL